MPAEPRKTMVNVRFTAGERRLLQDMADRRKLAVSQFVRQLVAQELLTDVHRSP